MFFFSEFIFIYFFFDVTLRIDYSTFQFRIEITFDIIVFNLNIEYHFVLLKSTCLRGSSKVLHTCA